MKLRLIFDIYNPGLFNIWVTYPEKPYGCPGIPIPLF